MIEIVLLVGGMRFSRDFLPMININDREKRISVELSMNFSRVNSMNVGKGHFVDLRSTDDEQFARIIVFALHRTLNGFIPRVRHRDAGMLERCAPSQHDALSPRQRPSDGFESLSAHQDGMTDSQFFEMLEIIGQAPRHIAITSDDSILRVRDNERDSHGL